MKDAQASDSSGEHLGETGIDGLWRPAADLQGLFAYCFHWSEQAVNKPSLRKDLRTHLVQLSTR